MNLNRSHAMAPMQNDDMMTGKFWPAFTRRQRTSVFDPKGQWPSRVDQRVSGEVKLQRKKSEMARVRMNAFRGSSLSLLELRMTISSIRLRMDPMMTIGM